MYTKHIIFTKLFYDNTDQLASFTPADICLYYFKRKNYFEIHRMVTTSLEPTAGQIFRMIGC